MAIEVGTTVQIKKDVTSQYAGTRGVVESMHPNSRYELSVRFSNQDLLGFSEDEVTTPRK